jgi:hypothetical protein
MEAIRYAGVAQLHCQRHAPDEASWRSLLPRYIAVMIGVTTAEPRGSTPATRPARAFDEFER